MPCMPNVDPFSFFTSPRILLTLGYASLGFAP